MSKPNLQANLTALSSRSGSSCSVIRAGRGVLIMPVRYILFYFIDIIVRNVHWLLLLLSKCLVL